MAGNQSDEDGFKVKVLVEIPKGSRNKYEYDPESDCIDLEGKDWRIDGWGRREEAIEVIKDAHERYERSDDE
jgi:inorganic pyrophosphatase